MYLKTPVGFQMSKGNPKDYVLKVNRNVYGQRQASRVWYQYLANILVNKLNFTRSEYDECTFYRGKSIYLLHTDDSILAGPNKKELDQIINEIKS